MSGADITFLHGRHMPECRARVDKHFEGYFTLQYMHRGAVRLEYGEQGHALEGQWVWPAYPGPRIRFRPLKEIGWWDHRYIAFAGPRATDWDAAGLLPRAPQQAPDGFDWPGAFDSIYEEVEQGSNWALRRAANVLENMLLHLAQARSRPDDLPDWLRLCISEITRPGAAPDYDALARRCHMSRSTLGRRFREHMGISPHAYAIQARLAHACSLLRETELPLKAIAADLGYSDVYFFSKQFRKHVGLPPGAFRESRQG